MVGVVRLAKWVLERLIEHIMPSYVRLEKSSFRARKNAERRLGLAHL